MRMTTRLGNPYDRGFADGDAGREFKPPYVKPDNRDMYAHGYYSGEYAFNQRVGYATRGNTFCNFRAEEDETEGA